MKTASAGCDIWVDYKWKVNKHWSTYSYQELRARQQINSLINVERGKY